MSGTITDALIRKATGQYDKEVVQRLRLEAAGWFSPSFCVCRLRRCGAGLQRISNIEECANLMDLCLARNEV